ncbi:MAG: homocysteine S-methyltransferase family protein, partial [Pseudomonadota bacterium]
GALPIIAKGNAGIPKYHDGHIHYDGTPELMGDYAVMARDCGATIIGGCCGTTPDHLRVMRDRLDSSERGETPTLEQIVAALGAFSSEGDGTGEDQAPKRRERRGRRRA